MKISGIQKLSLLDFPGKTACTVFLSGCNFRCPFCQNSELVLPGGYDYETSREELFDFLKKRRGVLDGVCISGGEPLINSGLAEFIAEIRELGYLIKLDTNGAFPAPLHSLIEAGLLDFVAMDIKNSLARYGETAGVENFDTAPIRESAGLLMSGSIDFEFRTTVVRELHCAEDFEEIGRWLRGDEKYFLQSFKDSGSVLRDGLHAHEKEELMRFAEILRQYIPKVELRGV